MRSVFASILRRIQRGRPRTPRSTTAAPLPQIDGIDGRSYVLLNPGSVSLGHEPVLIAKDRLPA